MIFRARMCVHAKARPDWPLYALSVPTLKLLPISNDEEFDRFCCEIAKDVFGDFSAQRLGRGGQAQGGIDITATNRRGAGEAIVIQCKFKSKPDTVEFSKLKKNLADDYTAALKHHHFDEFVFATTCPRDAKLQKVAAELTQQYEKRVVVWFWDDLQDKVNVHPRVHRLFADGGDATGATLIDHEFVSRIAGIPVNSFQCYCSLLHYPQHVAQCS